MVEMIPSVYKFAILFALIACHAILLAEGRQIKLINKKEASAVKKESQRKTAEGRSSSINLHQITAARKEEFQPTPPSHHSTSDKHNIAGQKEIFPPMSFGDSAAVETDDSAAVDKDDFRPTTPGNSPGVGHKHAEEEEDVESKVEGHHSLSSEHSLTGFQNEFRPTEPGHSPGVGHAPPNKNAEQKA